MVTRLSDDELKQIPLQFRWLFKLLLRLPNPSIPFFILKRLTWFEGVLWALIAPSFLILYFFFSIWLLTSLSVYVAFPFNLIIWLMTPAAFLVFFLRIQLERALVSRRHGHGETIKDWNISKSVQKLEEMSKRAKHKR